MSLFWENAARLMDAALCAAHAGTPTESMTVLINAQGGIQLIVDSDWPLDRLASDRGMSTAYRVQHHGEHISVQGREGKTRCLLEAPKPPAPGLALLRDRPQYLLG